MKLPTFTIGICAYNEQKNIANIILDVLSQEQTILKLNEIIVNCDGCTDKTVQIVKKLAKYFPVITYIEHKKSAGKMRRENEIYQKCQSDYVVMLDADVRLPYTDTLSQFTRTFLQTEADIVGGKDTPAQPRNFFESVLSTWIHIWDTAKYHFQQGNNVYTLSARIMALRTAYAQSIQIPVDILAEDQYLFFKTIQKKKKYEFCPNAIAHYKLPGTISDFMLQSTRYQQTKKVLINELGEWIIPYDTIATNSKLYGLWKTFLHNPLLTPFALTLPLAMRFFTKPSTFKYDDQRWIPSLSTK